MEQSFTWRRAEYFIHNRAAIRIACAQATALRPWLLTQPGAFSYPFLAHCTTHSTSRLAEVERD